MCRVRSDHRLVLGTFSFAKYLMWKDLAGAFGQLLQSPLVKHLLERAQGGEGLIGSDGFPQAGASGRRGHPGGQLFTPLPADSSQLSAVVASSGNYSFVLDGPPGYRQVADHREHDRAKPGDGSSGPVRGRRNARRWTWFIVAWRRKAWVSFVSSFIPARLPRSKCSSSLIAHGTCAMP